MKKVCGFYHRPTFFREPLKHTMTTLYRINTLRITIQINRFGVTISITISPCYFTEKKVAALKNCGKFWTIPLVKLGRLSCWFQSMKRPLKKKALNCSMPATKHTQPHLLMAYFLNLISSGEGGLPED